MSQLDQLINEIAAILNITPQEVTSQFTADQLNTILNQSICEPVGDTGPIFTDLNLPCEDPSPVIPQSTVEFPSFPEVDDPTPCIKSVEKINSEIERELEEYNDYKILLERLYEFEDNIQAISYYYEERIRQAAEILNDFQPSLQEQKRLSGEISNNLQTINSINSKINELTQYPASPQISDQIAQYQSQIVNLQNKNREYNIEIGRQQLIVSQNTTKYPTLSDPDFINFTENGNLTPAQFIGLVNSKFLSYSAISDINKDLKNYSEFISVGQLNSSSGDFTSIISNPLIRFNMDFQDLNFMMIDKERFDKSTANRWIEKVKFLIRESKLLEKRTFFESTAGFSIRNIESKEFPQGTLYSNYYNKLKDPINEFFSLNERGLTDNIDLVDPRLKGTSSETKRENNKVFYIENFNILQNFYNEFENRFETRRQQIRRETVDTGLARIKTVMERIARQDVELLLSIGRVNLYLPKDNRNLKTIIDNIRDANGGFSQKLTDLKNEIFRIQQKINELRPSPDKVKNRLKKENSKCFSKIDDPISGCPDIKDILGSDPFFTKTGDGVDSKLPTITQMCYWIEFAKLANIVSLLPIPNNASTLRYWPVGLTIPATPLIKVPLPIIWIPLVTISTPLGILVLFLTINGVFVSPIMFFASASGYKQHIITVRGQSKKFGYSSIQDSIKTNISIPISLLAEKDKKIRESKEKILGKLFALSDSEKIKYETEISILNEREKEATERGDDTSLTRIKKEKENLEKWVNDKSLSLNEKINNILNSQESVLDGISEIKQSIFQRIDDLGNPSLNECNKLKEKAKIKKDETLAQYKNAILTGNTDLANELREKLDIDGLSIEEKIEAFSADLLNYFNRIKLPKIVIPKDKSKLEPKQNPLQNVIDTMTEFSSNFKTQFIPNEQLALKTRLSSTLARIKEDLLNIDVPTDPQINVQSDSRLIKDYFNNITNHIILATSGMLPGQLDSDLIKTSLAIDKNIINTASKFSVDFDPFKPCCSAEEVNLDLNNIGPALSVLEIAKSLLLNRIDTLTEFDLSKLVGGKRIVSKKDLLEAYLSIVRETISIDLKLPTPSADITSFGSSFSGILGSLTEPKAPIPSLVPLSIPTQITIDLNIVKEKLSNLLKQFILDSIELSPQDLSQNFQYLNGSDLKFFLKSFIESKLLQVENVITSFYSAIAFSRPGNGINLNVIESVQHKTPPYGPAIGTAFNIFALSKANSSKSNSYSLSDLEAINNFKLQLEALLGPLANSPLSYLAVAAAGVANNLDSIRKIHPLLNQDDLPPWERLGLNNILFLVFLDEFISTGADQVGFFRSFI